MALDALYLITLSIFFLSVKLIFETEGILLKDEQGINMSLLERKVTALETSFQSLKSQCGKVLETYVVCFFFLILWG